MTAIRPNDKLSTVFNGIPACFLTEVHRTAGELVTVANEVRALPEGRIPFTQTRKCERSELRAHPGRRSWLKSALEAAADAGDNTGEFRMLTFTRKAAAAFGGQVHQRVHGEDAPRFLEGQRLITLAAISNPEDPNGLPLAGSTVEFVVLRAVLVPRQIPYDDNPWMAWRITGQSLADGSCFTCYVVDDSEAGRYALEFAKRRDIGREHGGSAWRPYYSLVDQFAEIGYWWAISIHRSQGRQYRQVWLDLQDVDVNTKRDLDARRRLTYVGLTRAEQIAHVVADQEVQG